VVNVLVRMHVPAEWPELAVVNIVNVRLVKIAKIQ
jgi:hypothetical protein